MLNDEMKETLLQSARAVQQWVYAPYSNYPVGAAVLSKSGRIYDGVNIENASYSLTICAERTAVFKAVSQGEREFEAIAVVTRDGGSPCGACRQVLAEFGLDTKVFIAKESGQVVWETTVEELLPGAFLPSNLQGSN